MKKKPYTLDDFIEEQEKRKPGFKKKVAKELKKLKRKVNAHNK